MSDVSPFSGMRVLVVEDDFLLAQDMRSSLQTAGAAIIGPVPTAEAAIDLLDDSGPVDFAILDVNLGGRRGYPVADALIKRGVPYALTTGYDASSIPERYASAPCCQKPVTLYDLERAVERAAPAAGRHGEPV